MAVQNEGDKRMGADVMPMTVAFEPGMYLDFTGYISFNGVEAYVRNATFSLKESDSVVIHFTCGEWLGGVWPDGIWHDGTWHGGTWRRGMWMNGTWLGGTFEGGNWYNGTWLDGTWTGGCWHGGQWNGGKWISGERVGLVTCNPHGVTSLKLKS